MSQAVKAVMLATKDLGKNERMVALAIAAHANNDGDAWPSVATIAEYVGCSERTVQRCLAKLVQLGRLVVRKVTGIVTQVYRLVLNAVAPGVTEQAQGVTNPGLGVTKTAAGGDTQGVTRSSEDHLKMKTRASAHGWRQFLPKKKNNNPNPTGSPYAERRGAALPLAAGTARCAKHPASPAHNCGCCRSELLGGVS